MPTLSAESRPLCRISAGCRTSSQSRGMTGGSCREGCADRRSGGIVRVRGASGSLLQQGSASKGPGKMVRIQARGRTCDCRCWPKHSHHLAATFQRNARSRKGHAAQRGGGNVRICRTSGGLLQRRSASKGPGKMVPVRARGRTCACRCWAKHSRHPRSSFDLTPTLSQGGSPGLFVGKPDAVLSVTGMKQMPTVGSAHPLLPQAKWARARLERLNG
jgi:hypothetical protein